ncbi:MAG: galactose mutarotase [Lachnospiraceae bacterium]|nr:galactose mutarotase [Lachnospiraceae bacterium]
MKKMSFGKTKAGKEAFLYNISNGNVCASITDYGANIVSLYVCKGEQEPVDVVLGYDDVTGYENGTYFFGCPVGRSGNRIAKGSFVLNGKTYQLDKNENGNNLHSGFAFYSKRFWEFVEITENKIEFSLRSPDGDQGYPGNLEIFMTYEITDDGMFRITYEGVSDQDTIVNLTNHSYFNLNGNDSGDILSHKVTIDANCFTEADQESIPTGTLIDVIDTPMDFRTGRVLGQDMHSDYQAIVYGSGYDHNWALNNDGKFAKVAEAVGDKTGIVMEVYTDLPGMQMYSGNFITEEKGKGDVVYKKHAGFCFETQYFPDAINHDNFIDPILKAGESFTTVTGYQFK